MRHNLFLVFSLLITCGEASPAYARQPGSGETEDKAPALALVEQREARAQAEAQAQEAERNERDLAAQEGMFRAADQQAGDVSTQTWMLGLSLIGTIFAAGASGCALLISMGTGRRQLRAYVYPSEATLTDGALWKPISKARTDVPGFVMQLRNSGPTPARDLLCWANIMVIPVGEEETLTVPKLDPSASRSVVPPGGSTQKMIHLGRKITPEEKTGILHATHGIYIFGRAEYRDAFKVKRFTNFRYRYTGVYPPIGAHTFWTCDEGNEAD